MNTFRSQAPHPAELQEITIAQTSLLLIPDTSSSSQRFYYLPKHPALIKDAANRPVFSLTLILSRPLYATDETVYPLIERGVLSFEVALTVPDAVVTQLHASETAEFLPVFARDATFRLMHNITVLATATATGTNSKAALSVNLDRPTTLEVLAALDQVPSSQITEPLPPPVTAAETTQTELYLNSEITYRLATATRTLHFSGSWATIYDFLHQRSNSNSFTLAELELQFEQLLKLELVTIFEANASGNLQKVTNPQPTELFSPFLRMASVILQRETPELEASDRTNQYSLRSRPHPMFMLDYRQRVTGAQIQTVELKTDLVVLFGGCLDEFDRTQFIHLVVPSTRGGSGGFAPAPRRIRDDRSHRRNNINSSLQLAAINGSVQSMSMALKPDIASSVSAHALINSDAIRPNPAAQINKQWFVDEVTVVDRPKAPDKRSLPIVDDPNAPLWRDRILPSKCWYAPRFELVQPATPQDPDSSPFLFSFERVGTSASQNILNGTVQFQIRRNMSAATQQFVRQAGYSQAVAIPTNHLSVVLQLPFIDEKDNQLKRQSLLGQIEENGDLLTVTVPLTNEWVRLCYGAIAYANFQREPAFLSLSYSFLGYVQLDLRQTYIAYGGKTALTPVIYSSAERVNPSQPYFNAIEATYYTPSSKITLQPEPRLLETQVSVAMEERQLALHAAAINRPHAALRPNTLGELKPNLAKPIQATPAQSVVAIKPELQQAIDLAKVIQRQRYAVQNQVRQEQWQVLFPCRSFGELYREKIGNSTTAVGCRDALQLGQVRFTQYEELPELAQAWFGVYRSLQQPGRFLILPKRYQISRYAPTIPERSYQPIILTYYTIDLENPANNCVTFHASLQPDIPPYARRKLFAQLSSFASKPVIEYPTDLVSETQYAWTVDSRLQADLITAKMPDCFQVALSVPPVQTPTLTAILQTSGIYGNVQFKLPDGSVLQSALAMELSNVTGPWEVGAVEVSIANNKATLTNKIESELIVSDLLVYGSGQHIPVEKNLKSGASLQVDLPANVTQAYPIYTIQPGSTSVPEEIRRFAEDIKTNVIFASQINFANHGLQRLDVQARIEGLAGVYSVPLSGDPPAGQVELLLPLTTFLSRKVLQFCITKTFTNGQTATTPWINWDLETQGNFVSLHWQMIQ
ncbi:MAG: hypothetical protein Kow00121_59900 [Elainellaceae cyanobacterium]